MSARAVLAFLAAITSELVLVLVAEVLGLFSSEASSTNWKKARFGRAAQELFFMKCHARDAVDRSTLATKKSFSGCERNVRQWSRAERACQWVRTHAPQQGPPKPPRIVSEKMSGRVACGVQSVRMSQHTRHARLQHTCPFLAELAGKGPHIQVEDPTVLHEDGITRSSDEALMPRRKGLDARHFEERGHARSWRPRSPHRRRR